MVYLEHVVFLVSGTKYYVKVDTSKKDCNSEKPHSHVTDGKNRLARISLSPIEFDVVPAEICDKDRKRILEAVSEQFPSIEYAYNHNLKFGTDD